MSARDIVLALASGFAVLLLGMVLGANIEMPIKLRVLVGAATASILGIQAWVGYGVWRLERRRDKADLHITDIRPYDEEEPYYALEVVNAGPMPTEIYQMGGTVAADDGVHGMYNRLPLYREVPVAEPEGPVQWAQEDDLEEDTLLEPGRRETVYVNLNAAAQTEEQTVDLTIWVQPVLGDRVYQNSEVLSLAGWQENLELLNEEQDAENQEAQTDEDG